ncbi:MAG: hypothetical protein GWO44_19250 [Thermoplasmata archaeon]|nr:hypothetical protein [Thermoplasmata archaeon]NIY05334.1 hypothetical protein [Thermoplasmata archaeon]
MIEELNEEVEVQAIFSRRGVRPSVFTWRGRRYKVENFNLYHSARKGETLFHYFSVSTKAAFFELCLNSKTLRWTLVKVYPST